MTIIKQASQTQISGPSQPTGASRASSQRFQCLTLLCPVGIVSEHGVERCADKALDDFGDVPAQNHWAVQADSNTQKGKP